MLCFVAVQPDVAVEQDFLDVTRERRIELILAAILSCCLTALLWIRTTRLLVGDHGFRQVGDDHIYRYMAEHSPGAFHIAPWSWRVLVPALARYMPLRTQENFEVIAFSVLALSGFLIYLIVRRWGFSANLSRAGVALFFSMSYATKFNIRDFWLTDSTAFLFVAAAILALQYRRLVIFAACLLVGTLAKESAVFAAPLCYSFIAERRWDGRALVRTLLCAAPSIAALIALRYAIPAWNGQAAYVASLPHSVRSDIGNVASYNLVTVAQKELAARSHVWLADVIAVITSFGALGLVLPLLGGKRVVDIARCFWLFLVLDLSQLIFTYNTQRLIVLAFVPVIIASLRGFRVISDKYCIPEWVLTAAAAAAIGMELVSRTASAPSPDLEIIVFGIFAIAITICRILSTPLRAGATGM